MAPSGVWSLVRSSVAFTPLSKAVDQLCRHRFRWRGSDCDNGGGGDINHQRIFGKIKKDVSTAADFTLLTKATIMKDCPIHQLDGGLSRKNKIGSSLIICQRLEAI